MEKIFFGYFAYVYMPVLLLLLVHRMYLWRRLLGHVYKQYPEEATVIRSVETQWYPWSVGARALMTLIKEQSVSDPELGQRAQKWKRSMIYFFVWFAHGVVAFFIRILLILAK